MPTDDELLEERKQLARTLVSLRYDIDNPALVIRDSLDEPVEQISLADYYNGPAATWLRMQTRWDWLKLEYNELSYIVTVRDFGKLCFAHLTLKPASIATVTEDPL